MATNFQLSPREQDRPTVGLHTIAAHLGQYGRSIKYLMAYITGLEDQYGFPPPIPLFHRGAWYNRPHPHSRWDRRAVEQWFADRLPPETAAAVDVQAQRDASDEMDARAAALFGNSNVVPFPGAAA